MACCGSWWDVLGWWCDHDSGGRNVSSASRTATSLKALRLAHYSLDPSLPKLTYLLTMHRLFPLVFGTFLAGASFLSAAISEPVRTDSGLVSGVQGSTEEVRVYKGIPFAAPPVGDLRWREPRPPSHWEGVRKADAFSPVCMQQQRGPAA